jgi:hypothetical protein
MKNKDDFDVFLENELKRTTQLFGDDGFKQNILDRLPLHISQNRSRNLIIYISSVLSCLFFFLIIDINIIRNFIIEFYDFINESIIPSIESILFISIICFVFYIIPKIEFRNGIS